MADLLDAADQTERQVDDQRRARLAAAAAARRVAHEIHAKVGDVHATAGASIVRQHEHDVAVTRRIQIVYKQEKLSFHKLYCIVNY